MNKISKDKNILYLSLPLAVLIIINSYCGLFIPGTYARETYNWYVQAIGQDLFNLFFVVPLLIIISIFAYKGNKTALLIWSGILVYLIYSYAIFCFAVHFNNLFLVYCFIFGLSFYSFIYFLSSRNNKFPDGCLVQKIPVKPVGIFLIALSCLFYLVWLEEVVPAILGSSVPKNLLETNLFTNPVHVLDLSIVLPGLFITAILLFKKNPLGSLLALPMLVFCVLMTLAVGVLMAVMKIKGLAGDWSLVIMFSIISLISLLILFLSFRKMKN